VILWVTTYSTCTASNFCIFDFVPPLETISSISSAYNPSSQEIEVNAVGSGFSSGSTSAVKLMIDGQA
jgi:hypothetical protein